MYYENNNFKLAYKLLEFGANINSMDNRGMFAIKYAFNKNKDFNEIKKLVSLGADINQ